MNCQKHLVDNYIEEKNEDLDMAIADVIPRTERYKTGIIELAGW